MEITMEMFHTCPLINLLFAFSCNLQLYYIINYMHIVCNHQLPEPNSFCVCAYLTNKSDSELNTNILISGDNLYVPRLHLQEAKAPKQDKMHAKIRTRILFPAHAVVYLSTSNTAHCIERILQ